MSVPSTEARGPDHDRAAFDRAAFDRTANARAAIGASPLPAYTLDAVYAAAQAIGTARRLAPFRDDIAALPRFDIRHLDDLEDLANALLFVHTTLVTRANRVRRLPTLAAAAHPLRALLLTYADLLVRIGRTPAAPLARIRKGNGYADLIEDLTALVHILRAAGDTVLAGAPVTATELDRASALAREMTLELGASRDPDASREALLRERRKLGALLTRAQAQLRRAMTYLRHDEGDAATLVPSLYAPKKRRGEPVPGEPERDGHLEP